MIKNLSYNSNKIKILLTEMVGKPFPLIERFKLRGTGSNKLVITDASKEIVELLKSDNNINYCNIEIRKSGIIIRFKSLLETYGFIIPFHKLVIFKGDSKLYSFYNDNNFIKFLADNKSIHLFIKKVIKLKSEYQNKMGLN
tara:strand:- start:450 stop:872 length:423 start_codon:yes stop_codon:yes gene_type:complete